MFCEARAIKHVPACTMYHVPCTTMYHRSVLAVYCSSSSSIKEKMQRRAQWQYRQYSMQKNPNDDMYKMYSSARSRHRLADERKTPSPSPGRWSTKDVPTDVQNRTEHVPTPCPSLPCHVLAHMYKKIDMYHWCPLSSLVFLFMQSKNCKKIKRSPRLIDKKMYLMDKIRTMYLSKKPMAFFSLYKDNTIKNDDAKRGMYKKIDVPSRWWRCDVVSDVID